MARRSHKKLPRILPNSTYTTKIFLLSFKKVAQTTKFCHIWPHWARTRAFLTLQPTFLLQKKVLKIYQETKKSQTTYSQTFFYSRLTTFDLCCCSEAFKIKAEKSLAGFLFFSKEKKLLRKVCQVLYFLSLKKISWAPIRELPRTPFKGNS